MNENDVADENGEDVPKTEARKAAEHFAGLEAIAAEDLAKVDVIDVEKLRHANAEKMAQLDEKYGATIQPSVMLISRMQCLIEWLMTPEDRIRFETFFELRIERLIVRAEKEAKEAIEKMEQARREAVLTAGVPGGAQMPVGGPTTEDIRALFGG